MRRRRRRARSGTDGPRSGCRGARDRRRHRQPADGRRGERRTAEAWFDGIEGDVDQPRRPQARHGQVEVGVAGDQQIRRCGLTEGGGDGRGAWRARGAQAPTAAELRGGRDRHEGGLVRHGREEQVDRTDRELVVRRACRWPLIALVPGPALVLVIDAERRHGTDALQPVVEPGGDDLLPGLLTGAGRRRERSVVVQPVRELVEPPPAQLAHRRARREAGGERAVLEVVDEVAVALRVEDRRAHVRELRPEVSRVEEGRRAIASREAARVPHGSVATRRAVGPVDHRPRDGGEVVVHRGVAVLGEERRGDHEGPRAACPLGREDELVEIDERRHGRDGLQGRRCLHRGLPASCRPDTRVPPSPPGRSTTAGRRASRRGSTGRAAPPRRRSRSSHRSGRCRGG